VDERKEKKLARGPFIKWEQVIRDLAHLLGYKQPQTTRREHIAAAVGIKVHALDVLVRQLRDIGALEVVAVSGGMRESGVPIRNQQYTLNKTAEDILVLGKKRGIKWGQRVSGKIEKTAEIVRVPASRLDDPILAEVGLLVRAPVAPPTPPTPFAALRPLKRDEAKALVEAARQYEQRMAFVLEEVEKFRQHGLTLDPAVVGLPRDERLESVIPVLDYVSRIERENERLQSYANSKVRDEAEDRELHLRLQRQENELGRMVREREQQQQAVTDMANRWSGKEATYKQRIGELEQTVTDLRNKLRQQNGAVTVADGTKGVQRGA
jgi:phosphopantetheinyl transferase (holo-ACP synthase)